MADPKIVFAALPHVQVIWLTEDGHFHLHPHNGGVEVTRESLEELPEDEKPEVPEVPEVPEAGANKAPEIPSPEVPEVPEVPEAGAKVSKPRPNGRKKTK